MFNPLRLAYFIKGQLAFAPRPRLMGKLSAIVGQDGMNLVGYDFDQAAQEGASVLAFSALTQFSEDKLGCPVNGDKEIELALVSSDLAEVQMKVADGIVLEALLLGRFAFRFGQSVDAMPLEAAMQAGAGQMRYGLLQGVEAVIQGQQSLDTEGQDYIFLLLAQDGGSGILGTHRPVFDGGALLPFRDGFGVDAEALGQLGYALLTILDFSAGCLRRCGARV